jgi:hypothetical protein
MVGPVGAPCAKTRGNLARGTRVGAVAGVYVLRLSCAVAELDLWRTEQQPMLMGCSAVGSGCAW